MTTTGAGLGDSGLDPGITAETIMDAIILYRFGSDDDPDWWHSVSAEGYPYGVDVNIYFDEDDGIETREAHVYPNVPGPKFCEDGYLETDTSRLLAVIPERLWPVPLAPDVMAAEAARIEATQIDVRPLQELWRESHGVPLAS